MLVLNHGNEENGEEADCFVYIKQNLSVAFDYNYNSVIFRRPGFNRAKGKGRLNIFDDMEFKRLGFLSFPCRIRGGRFLAKGKWSEQGRGNGGIVLCFGVI